MWHFVGVDFQMKTMVVDGQPTLLQLWDTAGQERCVFLLSCLWLISMGCELCFIWLSNGFDRFVCFQRHQQCEMTSIESRDSHKSKSFKELKWNRQSAKTCMKSHGLFLIRFRSIAKSYFRRADGVLLLYDVTCESSFLNVREWVDMIEVTWLTDTQQDISIGAIQQARAPN